MKASKWVMVGLPRTPKTLEEIYKMALIDLETTHIIIHSKSRLREIIDKKTKMCYLLHRVVGFSSTEVGNLLGYDHATILHHCKKCEGFMENDITWSQLHVLKNKYRLFKIKRI